MADPRQVTDRMGIDLVVETFKYDSSIVYDSTKSGGSASAGLAVTINGNGQVGLVADAEGIHGKLLSVEDDGFCSVAVNGVVDLPAGNAVTVTAKSRIVGALGPASAKGYIRNVAPATLAEVAVARHSILDASVTTAVEVQLAI